MEINIKGTPKEIAALVFETQEQYEGDKEIIKFNCGNTDWMDLLADGIVHAIGSDYEIHKTNAMKSTSFDIKKEIQKQLQLILDAETRSRSDVLTAQSKLDLLLRVHSAGVFMLPIESEF